MSWRAETFGARLVMLVRREAERSAALQETKDQIQTLLAEIRQAPAGEMYANTGEIPISPAANERGNATWSSETARVLPQVRPMRADHQDGGNTFRLNPVGNAVTEKLPATTPCPRLNGTGPCQELHAHFHTLDGGVHPLRDL